jgi:hypothetical protein
MSNLINIPKETNPETIPERFINSFFLGGIGVVGLGMSAVGLKCLTLKDIKETHRDCWKEGIPDCLGLIAGEGVGIVATPFIGIIGGSYKLFDLALSKFSERKNRLGADWK